MPYKLYKNSSDAWKGMLSAISSAKKSIYWEVYIFQDDTDPLFSFFDVLEQKAKEGIKVVIILDAFGSYSLSQSTVLRLKDNGVEILFFRQWLRRVHRKILIVDEEIAFLGGVNVAKPYIKWTDLHLRMKNKSVIKSLLWTFSRSYILCGGKDKELVGIREKSPSRKTKIWLIDHFPSIGKFLLREYYQEKIAKAKKSIIIVTPYFVPRPWLLKILKVAVLKGVKVQIIIPKNTDIKFMDFVNVVFMRATYQMGIKFYLGPDYNHSKAMFVDGVEGLIGSNNLDALSFSFNSEASVHFIKKDMVADLKKVITEWKKKSTVFKIEDYPFKWYFKPVEWLIHLISPVL